MNLADMSLDEFMSKDWGDSSADDDEKTKVSKIKSSQKIKSRKKKTDVKKIAKEEKKLQNVVKHQDQLDKLKEKDPAFHKFLKDEDASLLQFDDGDLDLSDEDDEMETNIHELPEELEEMSSDSELEVESSDDEETQTSEKKLKKKELTKVTDKLIESWKSRLICKEPSMTAFRQLSSAFHAALVSIQDGGDKEEKGKKGKKRKRPKAGALKYRVVGSGSFNAIVGMCVKCIPSALASMLDYHPETLKRTKKMKAPLPSSQPKWASIHDELRAYLQDALTLVQILIEPSVTRAFLRHLLVLLPYYIAFPKMAKTFAKVLIKFWSSSDNESIRVLAFLCITRLLKMDKERHLETIMKQCYLSYVANCKFTSPSTFPMINFMQQTFTEICAVDPSMTYRFAFMYIRQLAIHLRKAISTRNKETRQAVYNWQYVHSIGLWCRALSVIYPSSVLQPLIYPLVQVALGTIDVLPTTRYFPLRFRVLQDLTALGGCTNTYIPLLSFITHPLRLPELKKKPSGMSAKSLPFETMLKFSGSQLKDKSYRDGTVDRVYDLLMAYFNSQAHTIAFPELAVPTVITLKKFVKDCKTPNYSKILKGIVEKVNENAKFIESKRQEATFDVKDVRAVISWESKTKEEGVPFNRHYDTYKIKRNREIVLEIADRDRNVEERLPTVDRAKFMEKNKAEDKEELSELFGSDDDNEDFEKTFDKALNDGGFKLKFKSDKKQKESVKKEVEEHVEEDLENDEEEEDIDEDDEIIEQDEDSDMEADIVEDLNLSDIE